MVKNKYVAGHTLPTPFYGDVEIVEYINSKNVTVKFNNTGYIATAQLNNIINGRLRDKLAPYIYGVGIVGDEVCSVEGEPLREYVIWQGMLRRCYCETFKERNPTYIDCKTSNNFKYFPYFKSWCKDQIGFNDPDFQLDKDILLKGNKVYCEDLCVFVPKDVNLLFTKRDSKRGECLIGVSYVERDKKYRVNLSVKGRKLINKYFNTEYEAFQAYKTSKELYIKDVAEKWKGKIDQRVYETLLNYKVDIDD